MTGSTNSPMHSKAESSLVSSQEMGLPIMCPGSMQKTRLKATCNISSQESLSGLQETELDAHTYLQHSSGHIWMPKCKFTWSPWSEQVWVEPQLRLDRVIKTYHCTEGPDSSFSPTKVCSHSLKRSRVRGGPLVKCFYCYLLLSQPEMNHHGAISR